MDDSRLRQVFVAGIGVPESDHWHSTWARTTPDAVWVEQADWTHPVCGDWMKTIERALHGTPGPKLVVAHSLGCLAVAAAADTCAKYGVCGAFLVCVPDVAGKWFPRAAVGFPAALSTTLPFPSLLVSSTNDLYSAGAHAERVASHWRSEHVCLGEKGHINATAGMGDWPEGRALLKRFALGLEAAAEKPIRSDPAS